MKTNLLLASFISVLTACSSAETSSTALTLNVAPERTNVLRSSTGDVIFHVEIVGKSQRTSSRAPLNLAVVLDRSGSMAGAKLEQAKQAASVLINQLNEGDYFSLITYDTEVQVLIPAQLVRNKQALLNKIKTIQEGGSTALYDGVAEGSEQVKKYLSQNKINRVILLSDGIANVGPSQPSDLKNLGSRLLEQRINVTTIGLGEDYNEDLMIALAEASSANYYYVKDAEKLPGIFKEELGYLQNVVARNIRINIQLPKGIDPLEIVGFPNVIFKNNSAEIILSELTANQRRSFLVRCRIPENKSGVVELAQVNLIYQEPSGAEQRSQSKTSIELTDDQEKSFATLDISISKRAALARNTAVREKALKLADEGKTDAAANLLKEQVISNAALPAYARNEALTKDSEVLAKAASELSSKGLMDKAERKSFQYDSYRQKNQKE